MPNHFHVVVTGHLDEWKLPPSGGLPNKVHQLFNCEVKSEAALGTFIDQAIGNIVGSGAMQVYKDPFNIKAGGLNPSFTIPLHMLTHITWKVLPVTGEMPQLKNGEIVVASGKEVVKH